jgi:hypothetical protein
MAKHVHVNVPTSLLDDPKGRFSEFVASALFGVHCARLTHDDGDAISVIVVKNNDGEMTNDELISYVEQKVSGVLHDIPNAARPARMNPF